MGLETFGKVLGEPRMPLSPERRMKACERSFEISLVLHDVEIVELAYKGIIYVLI